MQESRQQPREPAAMSLRIAALIAVLLLLLLTPWLVLWKFGALLSTATVAVVFIPWLLIAGIPAPASGSKPASFGWILIVLSSIPATLIDLFLIIGSHFNQ